MGKGVVQNNYVPTANLYISINCDHDLVVEADVHRAASNRKRQAIASCGWSSILAPNYCKNHVAKSVAIS